MNSKLAALPLMLSAALATRVAPFANTNAGAKLYVCATAQPTAINQAAYEALTWVEVGGTGEVGEIGTSQNILTYDTWGDEVDDKAKGRKNAGDPTVECARLPDDAGQIILRTAALSNSKYAFKIVRNDAPVFGDGTTIYNRGLVTGPTRPQGRSEDFDLEVFTLGFVQLEIVVDPS